MSFELEDDRPIPAATTRRAVKYPFAEMEVGQCLVADGGPTGSTAGSKAYNAAQRFTERQEARGEVKYQFVCRKLLDRPGKIGIWRVA